MKFTDYIKRLIRDYLTIFAIIVITVTVLRQIFIPNEYLRLTDIFIFMLCALAGDLPSLIFYSSRELSEKEMRLRIIIHFMVLEAVILILARVMGWVNGIVNTVFLAIQIALIYIIMRYISLMDDRKIANSINKKLKALKDEMTNEPEEE